MWLVRRMLACFSFMTIEADILSAKAYIFGSVREA